MLLFDAATDIQQTYSSLMSINTSIIDHRKPFFTFAITFFFPTEHSLQYLFVNKRQN